MPMLRSRFQITACSIFHSGADIIRAETSLMLPPLSHFEQSPPPSTKLPTHSQSYSQGHTNPSYPPTPKSVTDHAPSPYGRPASLNAYVSIGDLPARDRGGWTREQHLGYAAGWEDALRSVEAGHFRVGSQKCKWSEVTYSVQGTSPSHQHMLDCR
jgi:hypothetical protein